MSFEQKFESFKKILSEKVELEDATREVLRESLIEAGFDQPVVAPTRMGISLKTSSAPAVAEEKEQKVTKPKAYNMFVSEMSHSEEFKSIEDPRKGNKKSMNAGRK